MENNQISSQENQIIDLTSQQFYREIIKWLNIIFWTGVTACVFIVIQRFVKLFLTVEIPNYAGINKNETPTSFPYISTLMLVYWVLNRLNNYKKSLKTALNSTNEDDLIEANYQLKLLFKFIALLLIVSVAMSLFLYVIVPILNS
jgi:hypothetical protein